MSDLFISYSRKDISFARRLFNGLEQAGTDIWIDWEDIPPGEDWLKKIFQAIEEADNFLFVISRKSMASKTCSRELEHARENNKRLIPVVLEDINPAELPQYLRALNWIFFRSEDDFNQSMQLLLKAINLDQEHAKAHTNYQMRALLWERSGKETGALLRGTDLQEAETWLAAAYEKEPPPSDIQQEYISASRSYQVWRQRRTFTIMGGAFVIMLLLSIFAFIQRGVAREQSLAQATAQEIAVEESLLQATAAAEALDDRNARATSEGQSREQRDIAYSQQLALQAENMNTGQLDQRLLLAAQAASFTDTDAAQSSLLNALTQQPHLYCFLDGDAETRVESARFSTDGDLLALGYNQGTVHLFDPENCSLIKQLQTGRESKVQELLFSRDGTRLAAVDFHGFLTIWELETNEPIAENLDTRDLWNNLLAISPDGLSLAVQMDDRSLSIVNAQTGEIQVALEDSITTETTAAFKPDGTTLAVLDGGIELIFWDVDNGQRMDSGFTIQDAEEVDEYSRHPWYYPDSIAYSEDGSQIAFASADGTYLITDERRYKTPTGYVVGFDREGTPLGFGDSIFQLVEWKLETSSFTGGPVYSDVVTGNLQGFAWNPQKHLYLQVNRWAEGSRAVLYDFTHRYPISTMVTTEHIILSSVFADLNGELTLITGGCRERAQEGCIQGVIQFWDPTTGQQIGEPIETNSSRVDYLAVHPSQGLLISEEVDAQIYFRELPSGELLETPIDIGNPAYVDQIGFNADGSLFAAITKAETTPFSLSIWNTDTWKPVLERVSVEAEDYRIHTSIFQFLPGNNGLITLQGSNLLYLWDLTSDKPAQPDLLLEMEESISSFAFSPSGDRIAISTSDGMELMAYPSLDTIAHPIEGTSAGFLTFRPDGLLMAGQAGLNTIQLYDGRTGEALGLPLEGHSDEIQIDNGSAGFFTPGNTRVFTPDGRMLASTHMAGEIIFWEIGTENWSSAACQTANRRLTEIEWRRYLPDLPYDPACSMQ